MREKISDKLKVHTRYKLTDGTLVPGVTTITGLRNKPALVKWGNNLGLQGIDITKYVDDKAEIGTLAHYLILCHLKNEKPILDDYSKNTIDKAENSFLHFLDWEKSKKIETILCERALISENYKFGGTLDWYGKINDVLTLLDFKTGSEIYPEYFYQISGYKILLAENQLEIPAEYRILSIPRTEEEKQTEKIKKNIDIEQEIFLSLLTVYWKEKSLNKE